MMTEYGYVQKPILEWLAGKLTLQMWDTILIVSACA